MKLPFTITITLFLLFCTQVFGTGSSGCSPACQNGGTCNWFFRYYCSCPRGYEGDYCQSIRIFSPLFFWFWL